MSVVMIRSLRSRLCAEAARIQRDGSIKPEGKVGDLASGALSALRASEYGTTSLDAVARSIKYGRRVLSLNYNTLRMEPFYKALKSATRDMRQLRTVLASEVQNQVLLERGSRAGLGSIRAAAEYLRVAVEDAAAVAHRLVRAGEVIYSSLAVGMDAMFSQQMFALALVADYLAAVRVHHDTMAEGYTEMMRSLELARFSLDICDVGHSVRLAQRIWGRLPRQLMPLDLTLNPRAAGSMAGADFLGSLLYPAVESVSGVKSEPALLAGPPTVAYSSSSEDDEAELRRFRELHHQHLSVKKKRNSAMDVKTKRKSKVCSEAHAPKKSKKKRPSSSVLIDSGGDEDDDVMSFLEAHVL